MKSLRPLLLTLATLACQPDDPALGDPGIAIRDSAGIRIVENPLPPEDSRLDWKIGPEPTLSIGRAEGEEPYLLHFVRNAMRLGDGRILVPNGGSNELRFFDAMGNHLATTGGRGEGPGELERLLRIDPWPGDSILARNAPNMGIAVFDSDGNHGRTFTLADDGRVPGFLWNPFHPTRDGGMIVVSNWEYEGDEERILDDIKVQIRDGEGEVRSDLGIHPGMESNDTEWATIYARGSVVAVWGDLVIISTNYRYELKAFTSDGELARIVRRGHELRVPTEEEVMANIEQNTRPGTPPAEMRRRRQSAVVAEYFPAYRGARSDAAGYLWVREYDFPLEDRPAPLWTVFGPDGRMLGLLETPVGLSVSEIGEDYILGVSRDELGVERVELWPLER